MNCIGSGCYDDSKMFHVIPVLQVRNGLLMIYVTEHDKNHNFVIFFFFVILNQENIREQKFHLENCMQHDKERRHDDVMFSSFWDFNKFPELY